MIPSHEQNHGRDDSTGERVDVEKPASAMMRGEQALAMGGMLGDDTAEEDMPENPTGKSNTELLQIVAQAESQASIFFQTYVRKHWERSIKAYNNQHFDDSKYLSPRFRQRSKVFRPKTRSAVRKNMTAAANALFSTADVVQVTASDQTNPRQVASAAVKQEILNYRLDRTSNKASVPWFQTAMGANQAAQIFSFCCTKQTWMFQERTETRSVWGLDPITREMVPQQVERKVKEIDRPECMNIPAENVLFDPNCDWRRPAQSSPFLGVRYPMTVQEIMEKAKASRGTGQEWYEVSEEMLMGAAGPVPVDTQAIRRARRQGAEPDDQVRVGPYRVVWVMEWFFRFNGEDFTFWTLGKDRLLTVPAPTREVYPAFGGERPYVIGFGAIEVNNPVPMSPVESWQQLQQEANDIANLRLDGMKHTVNPVAKILRGRQVDIDAVQKRGPDGVLMVSAHEDIQWDRPPDVPASAFAETNYINVDFDDLAGAFGGSTVQTNRSLNETVGGMSLMASAANSVSEFDLRVWIETWAEPVLAQLIALEEFYEDDETILAIAGARAQIIEKFGIDEITDEFLKEQTTLRVDVGVGAADPMQKLQKFSMAAKAAGEILMPFIQSGKVDVVPDAKAVIDEVFGMSGIKQAGERFFKFPEPAAPGQPGQGGGEAQAQAMQAQAEQQGEMAKLQHETMENDKDRAHEAQMGLLDRETKLMLEERKAQAKTRDTMLSQIMRPPPAPRAPQAPAGVR